MTHGQFTGIEIRPAGMSYDRALAIAIAVLDARATTNFRHDVERLARIDAAIDHAVEHEESDETAANSIGDHRTHVSARRAERGIAPLAQRRMARRGRSAA
jgi:hypothetical protein